MEVGLERTLRGHLHAETPPGSSGLAERDRGDQGFLPPQGPASPPPPDPEAGADRLSFTLPCLLCWLSTYRESGLRIHRTEYFSCWSLCQDGLRPPFLVRGADFGHFTCCFSSVFAMASQGDWSCPDPKGRRTEESEREGSLSKGPPGRVPNCTWQQQGLRDRRVETRRSGKGSVQNLQTEEERSFLLLLMRNPRHREPRRESWGALVETEVWSQQWDLTRVQAAR